MHTSAVTASMWHPDDGATADAVLFKQLAADGFAGSAYDRVMDCLIRYGYQFLLARVRRGDIFALCAEKKIKGLPRSASWDRWTDDDIDDLIQDTVVDAVTKFRRDALAGRGWRPDGGARLTSYFAGTCLFAFSTAYKHHRAARDRNAQVMDAAQRSQPTEVPDIAGTVVDQAAAEGLLSAILDPRLRFAVQLSADGYSHAEISNLLADGTTPRAVEAMFYRYRKLSRGDLDGR